MEFYAWLGAVEGSDARAGVVYQLPPVPGPDVEYDAGGGVEEGDDVLEGSHGAVGAA